MKQTFDGNAGQGKMKAEGEEAKPFSPSKLAPTMEDDPKVLRQDAAEAGRAYLSNNLSWDEFMQRFAGSEDDLVSDLVDLIEHEPKRGGFLGVNEKQWADYQSQLSSAIAALESGS